MSGYVDKTRYLPAFPTIHYHALFAITTRIQTIVYSRYLCVLAPLATYYVQLLARSFCIRSRDKYPRVTRPRIPRRWNVIFARGSLAGEFRICVSPPAATSDSSRAFVTCETHALFIVFTPVIHRLSLVRTRRC